MNDARTLPIAAGVGAIAGLRSLSAPLTLARAHRVEALNLEGTPCSVLGTSLGAHIAAALALGELIADKTPFVPDRTTAPSLLWRFTSGALTGASVAKARKGNPWVGALLGGGAAIGVTFAAFQLRSRAGNASQIPDQVFGLLEDAVVIGSGLALISALES